MCTEKHVLVKKKKVHKHEFAIISLSLKDSSWSGKTLTFW